MAERNVPASFRKRLGEELPAWEQEALVTPEAASRLRERYNLDSVNTQATGTLLSAIYIFGALFIGGGVISLVASHWESMAPALKVALIAVAMAAAHAGGFLVWKIRGTAERLGHALIVLGTMIFGANIWLIAQIFHIHGNFYTGFGAWALGATAVAYAVGSVPNALIGLITSLIWFIGRTVDAGEAVALYPYLVTALFVPFVYTRRTGFLLAWVAIALAISLMVCGAVERDFRGYALACIAASSLLYSWGAVHDVRRRNEVFARILKFLGALFICFTAYILSFRAIAQYLEFQWKIGKWPFPVEAALAVSLVLWLLSFNALQRAGSGEGGEDPSPQPSRILDTIMAGALVLMMGCIAVAGAVPGEITANIVCVALSAGFVWRAVINGRRALFWSGLLFFALTVTSRFFEWDTGLFLKALALIGCGLGILYGGVLFERHVKKQATAGEVSHE